MNSSFIFFSLLLLCFCQVDVSGHGRLIDPPSRASMWRYKNTDSFLRPYADCIESNYNDNELYCGGYHKHQFINGGKCGVCGGSYSDPKKEHEAGGKYAKGIITRQYDQGELIRVDIEITAAHKGYFEFRLCPWNNIKQRVHQECLDENLLTLMDGSTRWYLPSSAKEAKGFHEIWVQLPAGIICSQCLLQWRYRTGNSWGSENGESGLGLGQQEEFYGCADIAIGTTDRLSTLCESKGQPEQPGGSSTTKTTTDGSGPNPASSTTTDKPTIDELLCNGQYRNQLERCNGCFQYLQCVNGILLSRDCPAGTACDQTTGLCIHSYLVDRC